MKRDRRAFTGEGETMRAMRLMAAILLVGLASCAGTGQVIPQDQAAQFQQAAGYPYNSFYCP
jgi:hypothetical protein